MTTIKLPLAPLVLSIGIDGENGPAPGQGQSPVYLGHDSLDPDKIRQIEPDQVLAWLFCSAYDAHDIAALLQEAGFRGVFKAFSDGLPNPKGVTREISRAFPGLRFELVCPSDLSPQAARYRTFVAEASLGNTLTPA